MEEKKRGRGGCRGCGIVLLILLLLAVWVFAMRWGALEKLGLREPIEERVFAPPPDRKASVALKSALEQAGMSTEGVDLYVLPMADQEGSVAFLSFDASRGFDPERLFSGEGEWGALDQVGEGTTLEDLNITRLAFDYADKRGNSIVTLTTETETLRELSREEITPEEFLTKVKGQIDIPALTRELMP